MGQLNEVVHEEWNWFKEKFEVHGFVGMCKVKGFPPKYWDLRENAIASGVDLTPLPLSPLAEKADQILDMAIDGFSAREIATTLGTSVSGIRKFCKRAEIELDNFRPSVGDYADEVRTLAKEGRSATEVQEIIGFSTVAINRWARQNGVKFRRYHSGVIKTWHGYRKLRRPSHPRADGKGYVGEHVLVMEKSIGRPLADDEVVHHKDGNKLNNDISNLELMTDTAHRQLHANNGDCGWKAYHSKMI